MDRGYSTVRVCLSVCVCVAQSHIMWDKKCFPTRQASVAQAVLHIMISIVTGIFTPPRGNVNVRSDGGKQLQ